MYSKSARTIRNNKRSSRFNSRHKYKLRENVGLVLTKKELKTSFLNVDGLSRTSLADVHDFIDSTDPDVVFFFETKCREEQICFDIVERFTYVAVKSWNVRPNGDKFN